MKRRILVPVVLGAMQLLRLSPTLDFAYEIYNRRTTKLCVLVQKLCVVPRENVVYRHVAVEARVTDVEARHAAIDCRLDPFERGLWRSNARPQPSQK